MSDETIRYGSHEISVDDEGPRVVVDGRELAVRASGDLYWTPLRPYERFLSLDAIAQRLIDDGDLEVE